MVEENIKNDNSIGTNEKSNDLGAKITDDITISSTVIDTLIDEALWAHRERSYFDMFDCVLALWYMTKDLNYKNTERDTIGKRINSMILYINTTDFNNKEVSIPAYNIMDAVSMHDVSKGKDIVDVFDSSGNLIHMQIYKLYEVYNYIGRILLISLFEILRDCNIVLPPEIYAARYANV